MKKIGFIYGGRSTEHDPSLWSCEFFSSSLDKTRFTVENVVFLDRNNNAFINGTAVTFGELVDKISSDKDVFYVFLIHGIEGEGGSWYGIADILDWNGSFETVNCASVVMNKFQQNCIVQELHSKEVNIPFTRKVQKGVDSFSDTLSDFRGKGRVIVKPNSLGASQFTDLFDADNIEGVSALAEKIFEYDDVAVIQEYIKGREYTCGVLRKNGVPEALPVVEYLPDSDFMDLECKHIVEKVIIDNEATKRIQQLSCKLFETFGCTGWCRFDFLCTEEGELFFLEGNLIPGFAKYSTYPQMLKKADISISDFTDILIEAYQKRGKTSRLFETHLHENKDNVKK